MNIKAILALSSVLMVTVLMILVVVNIWVPNLVESGVFKKTLYTFAVLTAGSLLVSGLSYVSSKAPGEETKEAGQ